MEQWLNVFLNQHNSLLAMCRHRQDHLVPHQHQCPCHDQLLHCVTCCVFAYVSVPWDYHNHLHVLYQMYHLQHSEMNRYSLLNQQNQLLRLILEEQKSVFFYNMPLFIGEWQVIKVNACQKGIIKTELKMCADTKRALHNNRINQSLVL